MGRWLGGRFLVVTVDGTSMQPSLRPGDRLLVRRTGLRGIRVGQVAVLRPPTSPGPASPSACAYLVKRVAALPGDRVPESCRGWTELPEYVPPGSFIMLGDNPRHSYDSRFAGVIPAELLFGVAVRRLGGAASVGHEPRSGSGSNSFKLNKDFQAENFARRRA